jgi:predicted PP-loop superfamily ATPase
MDEARAVLRRLERIEALERGGAASELLLDEVRALLAEAEDWVRAEPGGTDRAAVALARCADAVASRRTMAMT